MKLHHLLQKCSFFLIKLAAFLASGAACMKLHGFQYYFHEIGGHSPPYGALKTTWRNVGWAAPTMIATGRSRPAAALI
jgi:hypothetical protein